jgi:RsiW-degrading membrane proteinase PrsW (M82 family)
MIPPSPGGDGVELVLTAFSAVVPALLLLWFFSSRDRFPEPPRAIWATFALGVLTIIPAALIELILDGRGEGLSGFVRAAYGAFVVAALVEELFKLSVLQAYSFRSKHFNESMDGVVYGAASGLGFATLENILYVFSPDGGLLVGALRAFLSVPGHALWGAVLGFYAGAGRLCGRPFSGSLKGLAVAVALHGLYDLPVMLINDPSGSIDASLGILLVLVMLGVSTVGWVWVIRLCRRLRKQQADSALAPARAADALEPVSGASIPEAAVRIPAGDRPRPCAHPAAIRFAGILLVTIGALLLSWAVIVFAALAVTPGKASDLILGGTIVGGIPAAIGAFTLVSGRRKLKRLRRASI